MNGTNLKKKIRQNTLTMLHLPHGLMIVASLLVGFVFLSWPAAAHAATDPCAVLKREEISKIFGETFGDPTRTRHTTGTFRRFPCELRVHGQDSDLRCELL